MSGEKNKIWAIVLIGLLLAVALIPMTAYAATLKPTVAFSISPTSLKIGGSYTMTWSSTNANHVFITGKSGSYTYGPHEVALSGTQQIIVTNTDLVGKPYIMTITATGPGGTATKSITVTVTAAVKPTVILKASLTSINQGGSSVLSWSSTNADIVTIAQPVGWFDMLGWISGGVIAQGKTGSKTVSPIQTTTFTATAIGPGGTIKVSQTITVYKPKPTVKFTASPTTTSNGGKATLSWTITDATNYWIVASGTGNIRSEGSPSVKLFSGSQVVFPTTTTTYTLTASGSGGTTTATVTIKVIPNKPTLTLTASKASITPGNSVTLSWSSTDANIVTIDNGVNTGGKLSGYVTVSPSVTTVYTAFASGPGGAVTVTKVVTMAVGKK